MISIFCTPKNFEDVFTNIQTNAITSWRSLSNDIEIIIFGNSNGAKEISNKVNGIFIPDVKVSSSGVPLLSDLFNQARAIAKFDILLFVNADIILPENFLSSAVYSVKKKFKKFLLVGYRWDLDFNQKINFSDEIKKKEFWNFANLNSSKHGCTGIDYFLFNKHLFKNLPDYIIGRPGYDNWLLWYARRRMVPLIDASDQIKVIHQNHHYTYHNFESGRKHFLDEDGLKNKRIMKNNHLNLLDTNYFLSKNDIIKKNDKAFIQRNLGKLPIIYPELRWPLKYYKKFYRMISKKLK